MLTERFGAESIAICYFQTRILPIAVGSIKYYVIGKEMPSVAVRVVVQVKC